MPGIINLTLHNMTSFNSWLWGSQGQTRMSPNNLRNADYRTWTWYQKLLTINKGLSGFFLMKISNNWNALGRKKISPLISQSITKCNKVKPNYKWMALDHEDGFAASVACLMMPMPNLIKSLFIFILNIQWVKKLDGCLPGWSYFEQFWSKLCRKKLEIPYSCFYI